MNRNTLVCWFVNDMRQIKSKNLSRFNESLDVVRRRLPIKRTHREIIRSPRKLIQGFKINDSADQIQSQVVTHSSITIGIFHNPKNLDLSIDVFNENAFM